jgi:hypothetical protein
MTGDAKKPAGVKTQADKDKEAQQAADNALANKAMANKAGDASKDPQLSEDKSEKRANSPSPQPNTAKSKDSFEEDRARANAQSENISGAAFYHSSSMVKAICYLLDEVIVQIKETERLRKNAGYNDPNLPSITSQEAFARNLRFAIGLSTSMVHLAPYGSDLVNAVGEQFETGRKLDPSIIKQRDVAFQQVLKDAGKLDPDVAQTAQNIANGKQQPPQTAMDNFQKNKSALDKFNHNTTRYEMQRESDEYGETYRPFKN